MWREECGGVPAAGDVGADGCSQERAGRGRFYPTGDDAHWLVVQAGEGSGKRLMVC